MTLMSSNLMGNIKLLGTRKVLPQTGLQKKCRVGVIMIILDMENEYTFVLIIMNASNVVTLSSLEYING